MIRYLLDTDIVSLLQDGNASVIAHVASIPPEQVATSIITVEEQLSAWYTLLRKARTTEQLVPVYERMTRTVSFLGRVPLLSFTDEAATAFDTLRQQFPRRGRMDLRIAAIALTCRVTLVTRNLTDFSDITGLTIEDWSQIASPTIG